MIKHEITGANGLAGWSIGPDDYDAYLSSVAWAWSGWSRLWHWFRPPATRRRIAYERPDGGVSIVIPSDHFFMLLRRGGIVRHMRVIDAYGSSGIPVFEGTGEVMGSMTEIQALEFIAWKDVPRGTNRICYLPADHELPPREHRNEWRLSDDRMVVT